MSKLHNATRSDIVWDRYVETSLEGMAREKRGKGVCRRVVAEGSIWKIGRTSFTATKQTFSTSWPRLCLWHFTKTERSMYLLTVILFRASLHYVTHILSLHAHVNKPISINCSMKIMQHLVVISKYWSGQQTQMSLYWLSVVVPLVPDYKLWVAFGTGKTFCYLATHKLAIALATNKA